MSGVNPAQEAASNGNRDRVRVSIGLDVGGTKIAAGAVSGGIVLERLERPTPVGGSSAVETMFEMVAALRARYPAVAAVGVGAAGMVDWPAGHIRWAPREHEIAELVSARLSNRAIADGLVLSERTVAGHVIACWPSCG
ncbi:MAG TPA: ROK family protein [Streptosporangiaceae bacterium]|nr:ROK family protein [Streptosporangiaceae bacterium]